MTNSASTHPQPHTHPSSPSRLRSHSHSGASLSALRLSPLRALMLGLPIVFFLGLAISVGVHKLRKSSAPPPVYAQVGAFELIDSSGQPFLSQDHLKGKAYLASFIFTHCQGICPRISATLKKIMKEHNSASASASASASLHALSLSIDPANDSPKALREFQAKQGVDQIKTWHFLTGTQEQLKNVVENQFLVGYPERPALHSDRFVLVDHLSRIRGFYSSEDPQDLEHLRSDLYRVLKEIPQVEVEKE